jgi:hypothetical protein
MSLDRRLGTLSLVFALLISACAAGTSPTGSPTATSAAPQVTSPEDAVARIIAERPDLSGIGPFDPDRIGGCCWYRATARDGGYDVEFRVGWGDCPAGCIDEHAWTYRVGADGSVELIAESGDSIPAGGIPAG